MASMYEMSEVYTLDEMLKLYALYRMDMDIQEAKIKEVEKK